LKFLFHMLGFSPFIAHCETTMGDEKID